MSGRVGLTPFRFAGKRFVLIADEHAAAMPPGLSEAEQEIVRLLREGASNKEIAQARGTSERTVANQVSRLLRKLGVSSRVQIALCGRP